MSFISQSHQRQKAKNSTYRKRDIRQHEVILGPEDRNDGHHDATNSAYSAAGPKTCYSVVGFVYFKGVLVREDRSHSNEELRNSCQWNQ